MSNLPAIDSLLCRLTAFLRATLGSTAHFCNQNLCLNRSWPILCRQLLPVRLAPVARTGLFFVRSTGLSSGSLTSHAKRDCFRLPPQWWRVRVEQSSRDVVVSQRPITQIACRQPRVDLDKYRLTVGHVSNVP